MAGETVVTVVGNLTNDPELRFTPNGAAVASFTVASTPRTLDRTTNEWKDGDALFLRCSIWRQAAEHVAESLQKGARVIVQGRLKQRKWTDREGNERISVELDVEEIGPSLRYATAKVVKASRGGGGGYGGPAAGPAGGYGGPPQASGGPAGPAGAGGYGAPVPAGGGSGYGGGAVDDPWSAPAGAYSEEPPF
ncbi:MULTISPECIES: single-stranded DNA-binding protein [unclassified Frankia]|uniref:single-stranded DNA-binding protein n=1 Tax=unclassified Frankia TaxID=2632575 RepID=UPI001EF53971|nr:MULTISPECIES: single-stranded DNA-binding protein [unclassified Frankia]